MTTLPNSRMFPARYSRAAESRRLAQTLSKAVAAGYSVTVRTDLRRVQLDAESLSCLTVTASGSLYLRRGAVRECLDGCAVEVDGERMAA